MIGSQAKGMVDPHPMVTVGKRRDAAQEVRSMPRKGDDANGQLDHRDSGGAVGAGGALASAATPDGDLHYRVLFQSMREGFALCEAIWDESGRLKDYTILEINPALQAMLGVGPEVIGARLAERPVDSRWLAVCERALLGDEP